METHEAFEIIRQSVVRIDTPQGSGTGFLVANGRNKEICGVATASHVIHHTHLWQEPIRITHELSGKTRFLHHSERAVLSDPDCDIGSIVFGRGDIGFPENPLPITPQEKHLKIGKDVCWIGYPAVVNQPLCLFSGKVSSWIEVQKAYLIDGVAINGVSGGPVFTIFEDTIMIIGVVSAYVPNRSTGEALPGLCIARDVTRLHDEISRFNNFDQAKEEEAEEIKEKEVNQAREDNSE